MQKIIIFSNINFFLSFGRRDDKVVSNLYYYIIITFIVSERNDLYILILTYIYSIYSIYIVYIYKSCTSLRRRTHTRILPGNESRVCVRAFVCTRHILGVLKYRFILLSYRTYAHLHKYTKRLYVYNNIIDRYTSSSSFRRMCVLDLVREPHDDGFRNSIVCDTHTHVQ